MFIKLTKGALLASFVFLFWSCSKKENTTDNSSSLSEDTYRQVYTALADDIIRPSFASLQTDVNSMSSKTTSFTASPSATSLQELKKAFETSYVSLQYVMPYEFGPSETNFTLTAFNVFPTSVSKITTAISTGSYNLSAGDMVNATGFPAIDFMLYHANEDSVVSYFNNANSKKFLTDVVAQIQTRVTTINAEWTSETGGYRAVFINNMGNSASSSLSLWVNNFNKSFESIKRDKFSVPSGNESLNGTKFPQNVEAYYSAKSLLLAKAGLHAVEMSLKGQKKDGTTSKGLNTLLDALNAKSNNVPLSQVANENFEKAKTSINSISETLAQSIESDNAKIISATKDLQACVRYFKGDIPSALSVQISYQDGDGD